VREALAIRFPTLGFERQKKVTALAFYRRLAMNEMPELWRAAGGARALAALGVLDPGELDMCVERMFTGAEPDRIHTVWEVLRLERWVRAHY